jgi:hypothetical protein
MIIQPPGTNFIPPWGHGWLQLTEDGYGIMKAQTMTSTKLKMGKSITTSTQRIIEE